MSNSIRTLTVAELIEILQEQEPDALVVFASDYGDHCHTQQAHFIQGTISEMPLKKSAYSRSGFAVDVDPEEDEHNTNVVLVIG